MSLFDANGKPITQQISYPLGPHAINLPGTPEQLIAMDLSVPQNLAVVTWAHTSVAVGVLAQAVRQLSAHVGAMDALLSRHPDLADEYQRELATRTQAPPPPPSSREEHGD
jgi:hypothetical protein